MQTSIVLTGGGTAGHVMPNIALLPHLRKHFDQIYYIGSHNGIEKSIIAKYKDIKYYEIETAKLIRKITLKNLALPFVLIKSICQCKKILKEINPKVIFSKGGYVAVPVVIAASLLHIPILAHESDSTIGLANKIIYRKCNKMFFSFEEAIKGYEKKGVYSGTPIRKDFFELNNNKQQLYKEYNLDNNKKTIVVVGGSLGSKAINETIIKSLNKLQNYNIINIVGKGKINKNIKYNNYRQIEFTDKISDLYKLADIVISRAGSNAIFELLAMQKLMILIPLPKEESRGDQLINAKIFKDKGFANVLEQHSLTPEILITNIVDMLKNKNRYLTNMRKAKQNNAIDIIIKEIVKYK